MRRNKDRCGEQCSGCSLSRRDFLTASATGLIAASVPAALGKGAPTDRLGEYIDIAGFRPKPNVRIAGVVLRRNPPSGWPGANYDLERHRQLYATAFVQAAKRVGVGFEMLPSIVVNDSGANALVNKITNEQPDAVLLHLQALFTWDMAGIIARAGLPTIVFAPVGTSAMNPMVELSRQQGAHVIASSDPAPVEQAFRMVRAKRELEESRVLVIAGRKRRETVVERLGTEVHYLPFGRLWRELQRTPITEEAHEVARAMASHAEKIIEPSEDDMLKAAQWFLMAKRLLRDNSCTALTTDCLGMSRWKNVPALPCMAVSLFLDNGVAYGCDGDLMSTLSLILASSLFGRPGYVGNLVVDTYKNLLILAHCTCPTRLDGFDAPPEPFVLRAHAERGTGAVPQVLWREGQPVTLVQFRGPNRLMLDSGVVAGNVDTTTHGGCRTSVEVALDRVEDVRDKVGPDSHHVMFYGNYRREMRAFCQMYGIEVINSPRWATQEGTMS